MSWRSRCSAARCTSCGPSRRSRIPFYQTESPKKATITKKAVATGSVVPRKRSRIKPRVSGIIEEIAVEAGQIVKAGDLIAKIRLVPDMVSLNNARNRLAVAQIRFDSAQKDIDRNRALHVDGVVSQAAFQQFELAYENAKAELDAARDNLDLIQKGISRSAGIASNTSCARRSPAWCSRSRSRSVTR